MDREALAKNGLYGAGRWSTSCFPGNGDSDWTRLFGILDLNGCEGTLDIEGWNDAQWAGEKEIPGQVKALAYLKACRESIDAAP